MNDFNNDNEIIEISSDNFTNETEHIVTYNNNSNKRRKRSIKDKWNDLSKGTKAGIIISIILVVLFAAGIIIYVVLFNEEEEIPVPKDEPVIIEKDNYRYEDGKLVFLDINDKEIGSYECSVKDSEKCYLAKIDYTKDSFDRVKTINQSGSELSKNSKIYYNKYVFVYDEEKISLYNIESKEKELSLNVIKSYDTQKNLIVVENDESKYGLIEITEAGFNYLIRCSYDYLGIVNLELSYLVAQDKDDFYIVDSTGKKISENINAEIKSVNEKYIVAEKNNSYSLYDYKYEELISDYDYISLHNEVIALAQTNRLYLVDSELNKLYEDGIRLENDNYVKKYVYDNNNRLIETLKSYEIEVKDNIAKIIIGNSEKEINIIEGKVSSKYTYLSYYDGKLYIYSDEEKQDILGTYTCNNKNNLTSVEDNLTNCSLYGTTEGISGIYNNHYVFISDNTTGSDLQYYLYDLKEKKNKGTYSSLEFVKSGEINPNIKPIYTSSSYVIAKSGTGNNKGNYGVLEINGDKVAGKIEFKYESITLKNDKYYIMVNINKLMSIYNKDFSKISSEFNYLEMYDKYYVGIKNNKLNVYDYDKTSSVLESDIPVTSNEFKIDFTNGFVITINNVEYKYDKNGKKIVEVPPVQEENNNSNNLENSNQASNGEETKGDTSNEE